MSLSSFCLRWVNVFHLLVFVCRVVFKYVPIQLGLEMCMRMYSIRYSCAPVLGRILTQFESTNQLNLCDGKKVFDWLYQCYHCITSSKRCFVKKHTENTLILTLYLKKIERKNLNKLIAQTCDETNSLLKCCYSRRVQSNLSELWSMNARWHYAKLKYIVHTIHYIKNNRTNEIPFILAFR